jgi:hypothetical protein
MRVVSLCLSPIAASMLLAAAPATNPDASQIIVQGTRDRDRQIKEFVKDLTPAPIRGQLARFEVPVCPKVMGITDSQAKAVEDRIRRVANEAGIPVAKSDCLINVAVFITPDKAGLIRELEHWPGMFPEDWGQGEIDALKRADVHVATWQTQETLWSNGIRVSPRQKEGFDGSLTGLYWHGIATRIKPNARPAFIKSVLVIQSDAIAGLTPIEVADYAAMRSLIRTDPKQLRASSPGTILSILDAPMGTPVPQSLTPWDLAFLKSFYASTKNMYVEYQRAQMKGEMKRELNRQEAEEN